MPHPAGAIIVVSILVAASIAAYENDNIRAWVERTRQKIATSLSDITDDFRPKRAIAMRTLQKDSSMMEDTGDAAKAKREEMKAQLAERARILEAKAKRKRQSTSGSLSPSFDSLVDHDGKLLSEQESPRTPTADTSAVEATENLGSLRSRRRDTSHLDSPLLLPVTQQNMADLEREMRSTFQIPVLGRLAASHASESLLDLTPTTEDFPDPDYSVPSADAQEDRTRRSDYFSATASSHTGTDAGQQYYYAHPSRPLEPIEPRSQTLNPAPVDYSLSSVPSVAGSTSIINTSDGEVSEDDLLSEPDGMRTPASAWTEVGSSVSGDDRPSR
jgi:hypothetical protein